MRLRQGQVWRADDRYLRIVRLERLRVAYKALKDLTRPEGTHLEVTKKEFCRLLKGAQLLGVAGEANDSPGAGDSSPPPPAVPPG